jgi:hypothetical protein
MASNTYMFEYFGSDFTWEPTTFVRASISSNKCTVCWDHTDMSTRSSWDVASSYLEKNVANRLQEEPFRVDYSTQQCELQCADGYWSDFTPADLFLHKCVSNNCKSWAAADTADACDACWDNADLSDAGWPGRAAYSDQKLVGRHPATPFDLVSKKCQLACDADHWPSYTTGIVTPLDVYDQRCTS